MTSGTYSPSLQPVHRQLERKVQESALSEATNDWSGEFNKINLIAGQLALMTNVLGSVNLLMPSLGTISNAIVLPIGSAASGTFMPSVGAVSNVAMLPVEIISSMVVPSVDIISGSRVSAPGDTPASELPQIEHRGWKDFTDPAEYEARLAAISPGLANSEAEEHIPPPPRGKIRAIPLR